MIWPNTASLFLLFIVCLLQADPLFAQTRCEGIIAPSIDDCKLYGYPAQKTKQCVSNKICNKIFRVSIIGLEPYSSMIIPDLVHHFVETCCGNCTAMTVVRTFEDIEHVEIKDLALSDLVYPILGSADHIHMYGFHFLPLVDETHAYFIDTRRTTEEVVMRLIKSVENLWPMLIICLLMAVIAGFPIWLMETWVNPDEFARPFHLGIFDAFWWSFISMTTVGYGDKTPRFVVSRLLAIIWILIGITLCSLFTASLTSAITSAYADKTPSVYDLKVGILKGRIHDASVVTKGGGFVEVSQEEGLLPGVFELLERVRNKTINGFVLDKYTYMHIVTEFHKMEESVNHNRKRDATFFLTKLHTSELERKGGSKLSYGILLKTKEDYDYFYHFLGDNRQVIQTCIELHLRSNEPSDHGLAEPHDLFSAEGSLFIDALTITLIITGVILLIGIIYEIIRCRLKRKTAPDHST